MSSRGNIAKPERGQVLGVNLDLVDYASAWDHIISLSHKPSASMVAAANTHLVGEAWANEEFGSTLGRFDMVVPDGMPLIWALRAEGHELTDRVYGPYLMAHGLKHSPKGSKHCFFGGSEDCLAKLKEQALVSNPDIKIADSISPSFGHWDEELEASLIARINDANADFVWVALGGVKQENWIARNQHRFNRGVFLAVGDAFALIAGLRPYAPALMQKAGLTWLHRLVKEPKRLAGRYLQYNTRFASAYLMDRIRRVWVD